MTNSEKLLKVLGGDPNAYATNYGVRKAILSALGGNPESCSNINEVDLEILRIYQEGGGGTGGDGTFKVLDGMKFANSTVLPESLDTSDVTDFSKMFYDCNKLTTIPLIDTSNGTNFYNIFYKCSSLTTIPLIDTSNGTNFSKMFGDCSSLTSVPLIDTSNGTNFDFMFYYCGSLTTIPQLDTSKGTNFSYMFDNCTNLTTIPPLDTSKGTNFSTMFYYCKKLTNITFTGIINYDIDFNSCTLLTYESVKSILTACSNTTITDSKTLTLKVTHTDVDGELAALIATCNSKGWTISGLTLN